MDKVNVTKDGVMINHGSELI
jgi:hypothetical protein